MQTPNTGSDREDGHADDGEPLVGDGVTPGIVRIGDTVRRPVRPFTATIQAYLGHLRSVGFTSAPAPLGIDDQGREVLSYVPGDVPREPLPPETTGEDVLAALARLIRQLHDASAGWIPPPDAVWSVQRSGPNVPPPVDGRPELVGHRDYCPGNVVFRGGLPAALIDFDLARPTTRLYDVANALYWWAPLYAPEDRPPAFVGADIPRRAAVFAEAYGMSAEQRRDLVPLARRMIHRFHLSMRAAAADDRVFRALWEGSGMDRLPRAETWIDREGPAITAQLTRPTGSNRAQLQQTQNHRPLGVTPVPVRLRPPRPLPAQDTHRLPQPSAGIMQADIVLGRIARRKLSLGYEVAVNPPTRLILQVVMDPVACPGYVRLAGSAHG